MRTGARRKARELADTLAQIVLHEEGQGRAKMGQRLVNLRCCQIVCNCASSMTPCLSQ